MRKVFVTLLIITAIMAAAASIWVIFSESEELLSDTLFEAVPLDAGLIVDARDYAELCRALHDNELWSALSEVKFVGTVNREMMLLDSVLTSHEQTTPFRGNILFSLHPVGRDEMQLIGYKKISSEREIQSLTELIRQRLEGKAAVSQINYDNVNITDISFNDGNLQSLNFSFAWRSGIFVFSRSNILIQHAIRQINADNKITGNIKLSDLIRSAGKNTPANIYINFNYLPRTALTIFHERLSKNMEPLTRFADWAELDLNIRPDMLILNGFVECKDDSSQWFETFLSQPPMSIALVDAMPSTTFAYFWMGIRRIEQYFTDLANHLEVNRETDRRREIDRIRTTYQIDLQNDFAEQFEDEIALVYANVGQQQSNSEPFAIFRIKSASSAVNMIETWQDRINSRQAGSAEKRTSTIDDQLTFTAYSLPFDVPGTLFGKIFQDGNRWCAVVDNYLLFGSTPANLQRYLHYTVLHANLQTNSEYGKMTNLFSSRSNVMFYCNPALIEGFLENVIKNSKFREIQQAANALAKMQAMVYQLNSTGGKMYNTILLKYSSEVATVAATTQTSWESLLDTAIMYKPQLVRNHSTDETDIFVQDMANNIYLINNAGRILWKVKLPEPIISPVYQIDIYRNGRLQMFFNTRNYLYVVDRLGNFVDRFPVRLNSPAVGNVALFDYDNNRQYRMMIACEDRRVYLYDQTGRPVDGWSFRQSEHPVQTDLYHFRTGNRDYIVFADKYRVYILDRQGRTRVSPEYNLPVGLKTTIALDQQRSCLLLTDTLGMVHHISLVDGKMTQQKIKDFPANHYFIFQDVDGDGQGDFVFAHGNKLEVFRQDASQFIDIEMGEPIVMPPLVYEFATADKRVGIVQPQSNQIWLYDNRGNVSAGFPMRGSTQFTIGRLDRSSRDFNLFVGSSNNFLYNYSIGR